MSKTYTENLSIKNYSIMRGETASVLQAYANIILSYADNKSILELGFGTGDVLIQLGKANHAATIHGVDTSKKMCMNLRQSAPNNLHLFQGNLKDFTIKIGKVHVLHFKALLHCITNLDIMIANIIDAVHLGGVIITAHEISQTEDRLEQLFNYPFSDDREIEQIFKQYFEIRDRIKKYFKLRKFPAGDSDKVCKYFVKTKKFNWEKEIMSKELQWNRQLKIIDILYSMKIGSFCVFHDNLSKDERNKIYDELLVYSINKKLDLQKVRNLPCKLKVNILRKVK